MSERMTITVAENGPYLVSGAPALAGADGPLEAAPKMALCRCGGSANKPFCDGAHAQLGFSGAKSADRRADGRESYVGAELTIHDNRGVCAHAGVCTEGLPAVWRMGQEPWIDPGGAPADEIVAVIRKCPSGALSYTREGAADEPVSAESKVFVAANGPYVLSGPMELKGEPLAEGADPTHVTLCRCGFSKNKPFCDGAHWEHPFEGDGGGAQS